jgi:hypothetical protein
MQCSPLLGGVGFYLAQIHLLHAIVWRSCTLTLHFLSFADLGFGIYGLAFSCSSFNSRVEYLAYVMMILETHIITYSKGRRDVKHHFIHLSRHPSVLSWFVYSDPKWLTLPGGPGTCSISSICLSCSSFLLSIRKSLWKKTGKKENMFMMEK